MHLRLLFVAIGLAFLSACDYTIPLSTTPQLPIDPALVGVWSRSKENGQVERLLVLPQGANEYLVSFPSGEKDALFARACLCRANERTLVQLTWFGTAQGTVPDDNRVYQYAACNVKDGTLYASLLNADIVKRDLQTAEALTQSIADNKDNPVLFREAMIFKKETMPADSNARVTRPPMPAAWR